jgi:hypothetical protein
MKLCKECNQCVAICKSYDLPIQYEEKCRRLQTRSIDLVSGLYVFNGPLLDCNVEREQRKSISERIFGEKIDKCRKIGLWWEAK